MSYFIFYCLVSIVSCGGSITSIEEERANLSAIVYLYFLIM